MPCLNKAMLIGNIGKDPEIKITQGGRKRVGFPLATSRKFKDANGETREQTDWHSVVAWGKSADILEQLGVRKGTTLYVEGSISYRSWDDQNGQKRYATDINLDTFQLLTPRNGGQGTAAASGSAPRAQAAPAQTGGGFADSDDLPF